MKITEAISVLEQPASLQEKASYEVFEEILSGKLSNDEIIAFLHALRKKGESIEEIRGAYDALMAHATFIEPKVHPPLIDTCGTGGDMTGTFNISTTVAFVAAGAGITVAKHGNRSVSSSSGSADIFEQLGISLSLTPQRIQEVLEEAGICFLFAPLFHSAMRHVASARKEMKTRTIFNILGPLCNPARARMQVMGIYDHQWAHNILEVLKSRGSKHVMIVTGKDGMDEITLSAPTKVSELKEGNIHAYTIVPEEFGFKRCKPEELKGGGVEENATILLDILEGKERSAKRDIVLLNAAAALKVAGKAESLKEALPLAEESINSGAAREKLELLRKLIPSS